LARRAVFTGLLFLVFATGYCQNKWVLRKDEDSIQVYTSHTENSKFKSIKAVFTVHATLCQLAYMVLDVGNYNRWQYNTVKPSLIKKISDHEIIYYSEVLAPWPVSDRDMVVHLNMVQDPETKTLTIETYSIPNMVSEMKNIVRVPMSKAKWTVVPVGRARLQVEYSIQIDPGGSVPAWMVNMVCAEAPHESFMKLREKIPHNKTVILPFMID